MNEDCIRALTEFLTPLERARCDLCSYGDVPPYDVGAATYKEWKRIIPDSERHPQWGSYISEMTAQCDHRIASKFKREIEWMGTLDIGAAKRIASNGDDRYIRYIIRLTHGCSTLLSALVEAGRQHLIPKSAISRTYTRLNVDAGFAGQPPVSGYQNEDYWVGVLLGGGVPSDITKMVYQLAAQLNRVDVVSSSVRHWDVSTYLVEGRSVDTARWLIQNGRSVDQFTKDFLGV